MSETAEQKKIRVFIFILLALLLVVSLWGEGGQKTAAMIHCWIFQLQIGTDTAFRGTANPCLENQKKKVMGTRKDFGRIEASLYFKIKACLLACLLASEEAEILTAGNRCHKVTYQTLS